MERLEATMNDALDRGRLQIIRADELVSRTLDKVEETTEACPQDGDLSCAADFRDHSRRERGLEFLIGARRRRSNGAGVPQDEMFI